MHDTDTKTLLSIQMLLGANEFAKIKMRICPRVGQIGESSAKQTKIGRVIMLPGKESDIESALFA